MESRNKKEKILTEIVQRQEKYEERKHIVKFAIDTMTFFWKKWKPMKTNKQTDKQ